MDVACDWPVSICGTCDALESLDEVARADVEAMAVNYLFQWTGMRYGSCPVTIRPCRVDCWAGWRAGWPIIALTGGPLLDDANVPLMNDSNQTLTDDQTIAMVSSSHCGRCPGACSCTSISETLLPGPIAEVLEVLIDGEEFPLTNVRVDDYCRLVRTDGSEWPICQDLNAAYDEPGAWSVTYVRGQALPPGASIVAGVLACELAKGLCGDGSCRLPKRVSAVTRQGVTLGFLDDFAGLKEGRTGIWEIDSWITALNNPRRVGTVRTPDLPKQRVTTWTYSAAS